MEPSHDRACEVESARIDWAEAAATAIKEGGHYFGFDRTLIARVDLLGGLRRHYANDERRRRMREEADARWEAYKHTPRGQETLRNTSPAVQAKHARYSARVRRWQSLESAANKITRAVFGLIAMGLIVGGLIAFPLQAIAILLLLLVVGALR